MNRRELNRAALLSLLSTPLVASTARAVADPKKSQPTTAKPKPLLRDFIGLNVHTVLFKPELYRPVCRLVRDYHGFDWDVGEDTSYVPRFPLSRNQVDWEQLYGGWNKQGYVIDVSLMFGQTPPDKWKDMPRDAHAYGLAFAKFFGPSGKKPLVESIEIGNEPGHYPDPSYRTLFENMARGLREGDPKLKVVTCSATPGVSGKYEKSLSTVKGLEQLYDVINLHTYAFVEQYPTWRRSYPEDPTIPYLKPIQETVAWRDANAKGKELWITEFGWDSTTKPNMPTGDFSKWVGSTDTQQAQYLVRSFLVFSALDVDRAYVFFFNDSDEPQLHGASGLTRNYVPKPAFHAVAHLSKTLGDYRFAKVVTQEPGALYLYEYQHGSEEGRRVWVAWSPTGSNRATEALLPNPRAKVDRAERMPLAAGDPQPVSHTVRDGGKLAVPLDEAPLYLWLRK
jgi:serine/threonine-protein kinase ATR